jgi:hypothetical protein
LKPKKWKTEVPYCTVGTIYSTITSATGATKRKINVEFFHWHLIDRMHYLGLRVRDLELLEACRRRDRDRDPAIRRTVLVCEGGRERDRDVAADGSRLAADGGGTLRR